MMKDKRVTIWFLVISVILIWGTIIYKATRRNPDTQVKSEVMLRHTGKRVKDKFEYTLLSNYPDPFFRTTEVPRKNENLAIAKKATP